MSNKPHTDEKTHFGYRSVSAREKPALVHRVFETVAPRYDLMNDLMSGGLHRWWKSAFVDQLAARPAERVIDVAGGTGDIAFRIARRAANHFGGKYPAITISDINEAMVAAGRRRLEARLFPRLAWMVADAEKMPSADRSFDAYTIAFGIRNVTDIDKALSEARRILRPGGRFLCLEFSRLAVPFLDNLYDRYSFTVIPWLGSLVAGDRESYQYLAESIRRFPNQRTFADMIRSAGFSRVGYRNLSGGIVAIHSAWRI